MFPKDLSVFARLLHQPVGIVIEDVVAVPKDDIPGGCNTPTFSSKGFSDRFCEAACSRHVLSEQESIGLHFVPLSVLHHNHGRSLQDHPGHRMHEPSTQLTEDVPTRSFLPFLRRVWALVMELDRHDSLASRLHQNSFSTVRMERTTAPHGLRHLITRGLKPLGMIVRSTHLPGSAPTGHDTNPSGLHRHSNALDSFTDRLLHDSHAVPACIPDEVTFLKVFRHVCSNRRKARPSEDFRLQRSQAS